ncbi:ABC transporter substrate-binding protein [Agarivorans aestuarii]|uniref:ABC transporter substrate-binding protein n=1 Tax=Agarivorans aestuarii TaxID=1563703 RepID=UPI001C81BC27|nr:ABC transporter substrate-binding protein [Agarivorans aestuarii]
MKLRYAALLLVSGFAQAEDSCGSVTIADMNWSSATVIANVDKFILEHGYGCDAELVPGDTMPTTVSMMEKGEPDIAPELWTNSAKETLERGVAEKRLRFAGKSLSDGGEEGFWVPQYLVDQYPEIATIEGVKKHAKLFVHPESKELSGFFGCPAGWNCQISANNLFEALELEKSGFELIDPGSGAGLSGSIAKAYTREQGWFGYYWAPTAVLGKYKMVKVDTGNGIDEQEFLTCTTQEDCENPKVTMYPPSAVHSVTTEEFASKAPAAYEYITKRSFTNAQMNELLAWMEDNQADGDAAMYHYLSENPDSWKAWVPEDVAAKVSKALASM